MSAPRKVPRSREPFRGRRRGHAVLLEILPELAEGQDDALSNAELPPERQSSVGAFLTGVVVCATPRLAV